MKKNYREKYPLLYTNEHKKVEKRYKKALTEAQKAASLLKNQFGAEKVWLFGSLRNKDKFHIKSDIDLAEVGIPDERFYAAVGAINRGEFKIDLVDIKNCRKSIRKAIDKEGIII
ncbi:MAG: nucleotidyltransferase family protein [bacterium]